MRTIRLRHQLRWYFGGCVRPGGGGKAKVLPDVCASYKIGARLGPSGLSHSLYVRLGRKRNATTLLSRCHCQSAGVPWDSDVARFPIQTGRMVLPNCPRSRNTGWTPTAGVALNTLPPEPKIQRYGPGRTSIPIFCEWLSESSGGPGGPSNFLTDTLRRMFVYPNLFSIRSCIYKLLNAASLVGCFWGCPAMLGSLGARFSSRCCRCLCEVFRGGSPGPLWKQFRAPRAPKFPTRGPGKPPWRTSQPNRPHLQAYKEMAARPSHDPQIIQHPGPTASLCQTPRKALHCFRRGRS
jgi:hypothetical protein